MPPSKCRDANCFCLQALSFCVLRASLPTSPINVSYIQHTVPTICPTATDHKHEKMDNIKWETIWMSPPEPIIMLDQLETGPLRRLYSLGVFRKPKVNFHPICWLLYFFQNNVGMPFYLCMEMLLRVDQCRIIFLFFKINFNNRNGGSWNFWPYIMLKCKYLALTTVGCAWLFDCFVKKKTKLVGKTKWVPTTIKNSHQMFVH
jgi:hypothetical protein